MLLKLQKRACKIIYQYSNNRPVRVMCYKTIIMPFDVCVKCHICMQVFHIWYGNAPEYLSDMFHFDLNSHYSLRSGNNKSLKQLKPNTDFYRTCFMYNGCKLWNSLPVSIRDATSTSVLNKRLQLFLFHEQILLTYFLLFLYNTYM